MPSRIAARSTTAGTPVKSCSRTRAGANEISFCAPLFRSQRASVSTSDALTNRPSSCRSRFSSRTFIEYGSRVISGYPPRCRARRLYSVTRPSPTGSTVRVPKLFTVGITKTSKSVHRTTRFLKCFDDTGDRNSVHKLHDSAAMSSLAWPLTSHIDVFSCKSCNVLIASELNGGSAS